MQLGETLAEQLEHAHRSVPMPRVVAVVDVAVVAAIATSATATATASRYDFLLVATSSFGEGDPPDNYAGFLAKLLKVRA